jgi:hypothetical protein
MWVGGYALAISPVGLIWYPLYGPLDHPGQVQKLSPPTGIRFLDHPVYSKSLYQLSCPVGARTHGN